MYMQFDKISLKIKKTIKIEPYYCAFIIFALAESINNIVFCWILFCRFRLYTRNAEYLNVFKLYYTLYLYISYGKY